MVPMEYIKKIYLYISISQTILWQQNAKMSNYVSYIC